MIAPPRIVLLGAGNLGYSLGLELREQGFRLLQVFSRTEEKARRLGEATQAPWTTELSSIVPDADLYLLAVSDGAIPSLAAPLQAIISPDALVAHCSGGTPLSVLEPYFVHRGVFYLLQTFSAPRRPVFPDIPICIDSADAKDRPLLLGLARALSRSVYELDDEQRAQIHLAAVFVNNFVNHLFHLGGELLEKQQLPFSMLLPLIRETVAKLEGGLPAELQTGPAIRGDQPTIERHRNMLGDWPEHRQFYDLFTEWIRKARPQ